MHVLYLFCCHILSLIFPLHENLLCSFTLLSFYITQKLTIYLYAHINSITNIPYQVISLNHFSLVFYIASVWMGFVIHSPINTFLAFQPINFDRFSSLSNLFPLSLVQSCPLQWGVIWPAIVDWPQIWW